MFRTMKKLLIHFSMIAVCMMLPATMMAQQEENTGNPRGVYKLIGLLDKYDTLIKEPYDQYKIGRAHV